MTRHGAGGSSWNQFFKERKINLIPGGPQETYLKLLDHPVQWSINLGMHPNSFTVLGLLTSTLSAVFFATGHFHWGGGLLLLSGTCDIIDGKLARARELGSSFGALFDSVVDRYAEVIVFFGISFYFVSQEFYTTSIIVFIALGGSLMVSYVRARAEGLGFDCKVGIMQRPERIVYMGFSGVAGMYPLIVVLWALAIFTNYTAVQRVIHVWRQTRSAAQETASEKEPSSSPQNTLG